MRLHRRVNRRRDDLAAVRVTWIPHQTDARVRSLDNDVFAFTLSISQPFRRLLDLSLIHISEPTRPY